MNSKLKANYKCHHCKQDFTEDGEEIYSVCNLILEIGDDKILHWRWVSQDVVQRIEYYFHRECFRSIAGDEYLGEVKG